MNSSVTSAFGSLLKRLSLLAALAITLSVQGAGVAEDQFPVRGFCVGAPSSSQVDRFVQFINQELAPRSVNTLVLRVEFGFQYASHPELCDGGALSTNDVKKIVEACRKNGIHVIPEIDLLGHQSWANHPGKLLQVYPEFDETPWVKMPEKYVWPNADGLYCKSYCPLHPKVHEVVFALIDELCDAFETDTFHAGMDEVFYIGEDKCPRCAGVDKGRLFADEVTRIHDHLATKGRRLWIWGDRLIDGASTGIGEWEASTNGTSKTIDLIPKDVVICDWHYDRADATAAYFAMKGLSVITCPWKNRTCAIQQTRDTSQLRAQSTPEIRQRLLGLMQTVWSGANGFMDEFDGTRKPRANDKAKEKNKDKEPETETGCFITLFDQIRLMQHAAVAPEKKRHLLVIGQSKGYQHEAISSAMAMFYELGQQTGQWDTTLRTDCSAVTKQPLKWEAKNLDAYDAVAFYSDGDLDMDAEQKAALLAFVHDDGKGLIGIHSAAITFQSWPDFGDMLGGRYDGHPWGQFKAPLVVEDRNFPGMRSVPQAFTLFDEVYQIKDFSREKVRVLMSLNASQLDLKPEGIHADKDFPVIWARNYGKGRVLFNGLGHVPAVWDRADMRAMWLDMTLWAMGALPGDATPQAKAAQ